MSDKKPESSETLRKRGFATMDRNHVRDLARKGGLAAHRAGTAHEFNSEEARAAGRKGGIASHATLRDGATTRVPDPRTSPRIDGESD
jgi:general stress protein YciG